MFSVDAETEFMNGWASGLNSKYKFRTVDEWLLRGGPSMKVPDMLEYSIWFHTYSYKKLYFLLKYKQACGFSDNLNQVSFSSEISYRPWSNFVISLEPYYEKNIDELQYINQVENKSGQKVYLLGKVDNRNLSFTFRADLALTPELTVQYYGSPFVSIAKYSVFKEITKPLDPSYKSRFIIVEPDKEGLIYNFDNNHDGIVEYSVFNPDFNFQQYKSNFVLRWEYRAGSAIYFIWSQNRTDLEQSGPFNFRKGYKEMFGLFPKNIFLIKFNYWFSK